MVGTIGREHSGSLACNLNWVISTKNNYRAPRRRKTFPLVISKETTERVWQDDSISTSGEISVMESEKLGVTILGRRFGEPIQQVPVPIKKRRFMQSQPISSSSPLCFTEQTHCLSACRDRKVHRSNEKKLCQGTNIDKSRIVRDLNKTTSRTSNLRTEYSKPGEGADFYGISILAAAACDSGLASADIMISSKQENEISKINVQKKDEPNNMEEFKIVLQSKDATGCATALSVSEVSTSALLKEGNQTKIKEPGAIEHHLNDCSKLPPSNSDSIPNSSLREEKFCWDLNKAVDDAWEVSELDFVGSRNPYFIKNAVHATTKSDKQGTYLIEGGQDGAHCLTKLHEDLTNEKLKDGEMYNHFDASGKKLQIHDCNNDIDFGSESQGLSIVFAVDSAQSNCQVSDNATRIANEKEVSSNADDSLASGVVSTDDCMLSSFNVSVADAEDLNLKKVSSLHDTECSQNVGLITNTLIASKASGTLVGSSDTEKVFGSSKSCIVEEGQTETVSKTSTLCISETIIKSPHKIESPLVSQDVNIQESGGSTDLNIQLENFTELKDKPVQYSNPVECIQKELRGSINESSSKLYAGPVQYSNPVECIQKELRGSINESGSKLYAGAEEILESVDGTVRTSEDCVPERPTGWCSTSFHNDKEQQHVESKKIGTQEDDDSQYEDGEFRVSNDWGLDGCDEETEHVDYGSDDKDTIASESSPDHFTSAGPPHLDTAGLELQKSFVHEDIRADASVQVSTCLMETGLRHYQNSNVETVKKSGGLDRGRRICNSRDEREVPLRGRFFAKQNGTDGKTKFDSGHFVLGNNDAKESSQSTFLKMKSSGWDQLPERSRLNRIATGGDRSAGSRKTRTVSPDDVSTEGCGRVELKQRTDPSSRLHRSNYSEISQKADAQYFWRKRGYPNDPNHSIERNEDRAMPVRSSAGVYEKGGRYGESWDGSWTKSPHNFSPGHHNSRFSQSRLKHAVESPLKVKSNGCVTAHDETVDTTDCEFNSWAIGHNTTTSRQDSQRPPKGRISPTGRDERSNFGSPGMHANTSCGRTSKYEPRIITTGHGQRYLGPMSDDDIDSMLPTQSSFSRNVHKFSPRRGSVHMPKVQTRSRSRSRSITRSPHLWRSPRRKTDGEMNGSKRWSRSPPNFRIDRGERTRIPLRRPDLYDEMMDFAPTRSRASPPLSTRWIDERKDLRCNSRERGYRGSAGRSTSERFFSQDRRIFMENVRLKNEDYRQSSNTGRFRDFFVDKRSRFDDSTDKRKYHNRYQRFTSPSGRHHVAGDNKLLNYDDHDSFRPRISRHRTGQEFECRGSPRNLDDDLEKQIEVPPCSNGSHHFRYGRDVRQDKSFKSLEIQDFDDDTTVRRRLP